MEGRSFAGIPLAIVTVLELDKYAVFGDTIPNTVTTFAVALYFGMFSELSLYGLYAASMFSVTQSLSTVIPFLALIWKSTSRRSGVSATLPKAKPSPFDKEDHNFLIDEPVAVFPVLEKESVAVNTML